MPNRMSGGAHCIGRGAGVGIYIGLVADLALV